MFLLNNTIMILLKKKLYNFLKILIILVLKQIKLIILGPQNFCKLCKCK